MEQRLRAQLFDITGQAVWSSGLINTTSLNGRQVNVERTYKWSFLFENNQ